ncbi:MAG: hypothetical protein AAGG99_03155 [Pseudomonadota bacterium]
MARQQTRITISARIIDTEDEVVAIDALTRTAIGRDPARVRQMNTAFMLALVAGAAAAGSYAAMMLPAAMGAGAVAAIALIRGLMLLRRQSLFLITSDGRASVLLEDDDDFMRDVLKIVREGIAGQIDPDALYEVDRDSQQIVRRGGAVEAVSAGISGTAQVGANGISSNPTTDRPDPRAETPLDTEPDLAGLDAARRSTRAALNGRGGPHANGAVTPVSLDGDDVDDRPSIGGGAHPTMLQHDPLSGSQPVDPARAVQTFDTLLQRIAPQYGQRFTDVELWLRPVREHLVTGDGTNRADAQARWMIFAREHLPALTSLSNVPGDARTISRAMGVSHPS